MTLTKNPTNIKIAIILAGCGHFDGAEIREAVLSMLALDNLNIFYQLFSIDEEQHHVINHYTGEVSKDESRNILVESARIGRGNVANITELDINNFDALLLPGGFGVAKNFTSFAFVGHDSTINTQIKKSIQDFHSQGKPIGAICISPILLALSLDEDDKKSSPTLTIGDDQGTAEEITQLGVIHQNCATTDCVVDQVNKLVTSPAYMNDKARLKDVNVGIVKLVDELVKLI